MLPPTVTTQPRQNVTRLYASRIAAVHWWAAFRDASGERGPHCERYSGQTPSPAESACPEPPPCQPAVERRRLLKGVRKLKPLCEAPEAVITLSTPLGEGVRHHQRLLGLDRCDSALQAAPHSTGAAKL
jgi:hypothetical protein